MPEIVGFAHVELSVRDLDASSAWYRQLLGGLEVFRARNEAEHLNACAIVEPNSGIVLAFTQHDAEDASTFSPRRAGLDHISLAVADRPSLDAWVARATELGFEHDGVQDQGYASSFTVNDPDGIPVEFFLPPQRS